MDARGDHVGDRSSRPPGLTLQQAGAESEPDACAGTASVRPLRLRQVGAASDSFAALPREVLPVAQRLRARSVRILGEDLYVKTSVLVPLVCNSDGQYGVLFEKRAQTLRRQAGDVCFPGGHVGEQENECAAAVRETAEELCIGADRVSVMSELDVLVGFGQLIVYPYAGFISADPAELEPNPAEVAEVFTVSLERLLAAQPDLYNMTFMHTPGNDFPFHLVPNGRHYRWRQGVVPQLFYQFDGHVIWGLTARILTHFLDLIRDLPELSLLRKH